MKKNNTQQSRKKKSVLILGAGLAGLAAGYELTKAGYSVKILEKEQDIGGLARTFEKNGFKFDSGPHRWYTKSDMVNTWMLNLLGDEVIKVPRLTRIFFDNTFFEYPIKIKSTIIGMGIPRTIRALIDYFIVRVIQIFYKKEPVTLEEGYIHKFGYTLYQMFFKRYSEKLWGTSNSKISADWIGQRTRGFNFLTIITEALFKTKSVVSFVDEFSYPKDGIGRIAQKLGEEIKKNGGVIVLNAQVTKINHDTNSISHVCFVENSEEKIIEVDEVISSIPISDLIFQLSPQVPQQVSNHTKKLTYRDELQVALFVKKTKITPDTWIYVHSLEVPFVRMMEMDNWNTGMSPEGTTTLIFEIACNQGDEWWTMDDKKIVTEVTESFIKEFGLITKNDVIGSYVHRMEKEYPVYHIGYKEDLKVIKDYLKKYRNLQLIGRNGIFRYNNMDHSIEMGLYSAWNIIENERKFDPETVNIEREYLEIKKAQGADAEYPEDEQIDERH